MLPCDPFVLSLHSGTAVEERVHRAQCAGMRLPLKLAMQVARSAIVQEVCEARCTLIALVIQSRAAQLLTLLIQSTLLPTSPKPIYLVACCIHHLHAADTSSPFSSFAIYTCIYSYEHDGGRQDISECVGEQAGLRVVVGCIYAPL